ncbi:MAG TPA: hypothetical protein VM433_06505 [Mycobacteriales bacterium]|nr:hypothetical protein [Mycobacteriales bacterium]
MTEPATTEQDLESEPAPAPSPPAGGRRRLPDRPPWWALVVVAALAVVGLVASLFLLLGRPSETELRESALLAARSYTTTLTTFDARTFDEDVEAVKRVATEEFSAEYDQTVSTLRDQVQAEQAISVGTVVGAGLESLEGDRATVLVAVNQELVTAGQQPRTEANRVRMVLLRTGGNWLVQDVDRL